MSIKQEVEDWLDAIVIELNLCPFAQYPRRQNQIEICISQAESIEHLMTELVDQGHQLIQTTPEQLETTLVVVPELLGDFDNYLDCLYLAEQLFEAEGWQGVLQIASFHPQYQFAETEPDDLENLTNRSPYPIFHLLREDSVTEAIASYGDTSAIPIRNKETVAQLDDAERRKLFGYLKL